MTSRATVRRLLVPAVLGVLVVWLVLYPLARLILTTMLGATGTPSLLGPYREALASPIALSAIWGTVWLTLASLLVAVPAAVLLAWITASSDAPLARRFAVLPIISLAVNPLVGSIGWLVLLAPRVGILNTLVRKLFNLHVSVGPFDAYSIPVIVLLMALYVLPFVYGPVYAAFTQVDASLGEAARVAGAGDRTVLWTVTVPVLRPAILAGTLIGGVMAASMFAIPLILASGTGLHVIPTLIYSYVTQEGRPGPATAMASFLSLLTVTGLVLYVRALGAGRFTTLTGKGSRRRRARLGPWKWVATAFLLLVVLLSLVIPMLTLVYLSLVGFWGADVLAQPLNFNQYARLWDFPFAMQGLFNSAWLSAIGAALALLLGLLIGYRHVRRPGWLDAAISFVASLPLGIPAIVIGLAVLFSFTGNPFPLYGTPLILILGYAVHVLPISLRNADAGLRQVSAELEEAGLVTGDSRFGVMRRILVPLLRQPLLTAWALTFIILYRDLSISVLLYTPATIPSSVALLGIFDQGWVTGAAAYAIVMTAISAVVVGAVLRLGGGGVMETAGQ